MAHFTYFFIYWWAFWLYFLATVNNAAISMHVQLFLQQDTDYFFNAQGGISGTCSNHIDLHTVCTS